jgi:glycosyltransferase involved in cell wall biosynthesis
MKVLNVQPFDYFGSIQLRSLSVAEGLLAYGIDTAFVVPHQNEGERLNSFSAIAAKKGFRVYTTHCVRPLNIKNNRSLLRLIALIFYLPYGLLDLYRIYEVEKPDATQINGFVSIQEAFFACFLQRKKRYWVLISDLYPRISVIAWSFMIRHFDRVFVSRKLIQYYFGSFNDIIIYEPVNTEFFDPRIITIKEKELVSAKFFLGSSSPVLVSIAMISPAKGLEYLLQTIQTLKTFFPNIRLIIIGGIIPSQKEYYDKLRNLALKLDVNNQVIFTNYVSTADLRSLLSIADVFVLSSIHEGTPVSILEAMSMKKAVVATDVGGVSEQVINGVTGLLVPPKNPEALAKALLRLLKNRSELLAMEEQSRHRVEKKFNVRKCIESYRNVFLRNKKR